MRHGSSTSWGWAGSSCRRLPSRMMRGGAFAPDSDDVVGSLHVVQRRGSSLWAFHRGFGREVAAGQAQNHGGQRLEWASVRASLVGSEVALASGRAGPVTLSQQVGKTHISEPPPRA